MANNSNKTVVMALALGHGMTDMYANFLPALLPLFQDEFSLSKTLIGGLIFGISTSGSLTQVLFGYLGDRSNSRYFLVPGPAIAAIFMCAIGLSPNFAVLFALLILGGMGVSAFHPHAASFTGSRSGAKRGFGLSIFMTGGTVGYAAGPLLAAALISSRFIGPARMPLFAVFGILTSLLLYKYATLPDEEPKKHQSTDIIGVIKPHIRPLTFLSLLVIFKASVSIVFVNFTSLLMKQRGWSLVVGGSSISIFVFCTAIGTIIGGYFYDRYSRKKMLIYSLILSSPFLLCMVYFGGAWFFVFLAISGMLIGFSNTIPLGMAQELMPEGAATASSIMMGFSWGVAGVLAWGFGIIADLFGGDVAPAMSIAAFLPILAAMLGIGLSNK